MGWRRAQRRRRRKAIRRATPVWVRDNVEYRREIRRLYKKMAKMNRAAGFVKYSIDHIVPLKSDLVCGLHTPANMIVIEEKINQKKSNLWWPDGPIEQMKFDTLRDFEPYQVTLI